MKSIFLLFTAFIGIMVFTGCTGEDNTVESEAPEIISQETNEKTRIEHYVYDSEGDKIELIERS